MSRTVEPLPNSNPHDGPFPWANAPLRCSAPYFVPHQGQAGQAEASGPLGLVRLETTDTSNRETLQIQAKARRLMRMKKAVMNTGNLFEEDSRVPGQRTQSLMVTLTYRGVRDWRPTHIHDCLNRVRQYVVRQKIPCK